MPLDDTSHLSRSPSLTSSVDTAKSFSLPSPKGSDLVCKPLQFQSKLPYHNSRFKQPSIRRMSASDVLSQPRCFSTSPPSSPSNNPSKKRDTGHESCSPQSPMRYHPYIPRGRGVIPPALHYAARSLGVMSPTDVTLEEVEEVCCIIALASRRSYAK